jgi:hypothetical protein
MALNAPCRSHNKICNSGRVDYKGHMAGIDLLDNFQYITDITYHISLQCRGQEVIFGADQIPAKGYLYTLRILKASSWFCVIFINFFNAKEAARDLILTPLIVVSMQHEAEV